MASFDRAMLQRLPVRIGLNESIHQSRWNILEEKARKLRPFTTSLFLSLPNELILEVADYLNLKNLARLSRVNRHLRQLLVSLVYRVGSREVDPHFKCYLYTWLHYAAATGDVPLARRLIAEGADPRKWDDTREWSPLYVAVVNGHIEIVEEFGLTEADMHRRHLGAGASLLHAAVEGRSEYLIRRCIGLGASIEARDALGDTPLHHAAGRGNIHIVRLLVELGAPVNARDRPGLVPLHRAASARAYWDRPDTRGETIQFLVSCGAAVDAPDNRGCTPSLVAAGCGNLSSIQLLYALGARLDERDSMGRAALHEAASSTMITDRDNRIAMINLLCGLGMKVDVRDSMGETPLHLAAFQGYPEAIRRLVELGAKLDCRNALGQTPLHGVALDDLSIIRLLGALGADVNAKDYEGMTPLHQVIIDGTENMALELIRLGSDLDMKSNDGLTPWDIAIFEEMETLIEMYKDRYVPEYTLYDS
ncbi:hypothetical protein EYZ11_006039 [Aspergillus tanneri]|uniref:F-box domain-containing protein n=1 Tax=Aspergillus tanneri TaxID=1220188 RepID=A0A4V3UPB8_9EURO|nr:uncharacterized protein ATNIH1004_004781 [Aspergillus tanneri]KAA8648894.1 hypothetical protein ATNIH1004_004781 [Aspergillus tanneri]THC94474.1 hypothetical protein EYZ11_006039 [Aspergillus tanneri]